MIFSWKQQNPTTEHPYDGRLGPNGIGFEKGGKSAGVFPKGSQRLFEKKTLGDFEGITYYLRGGFMWFQPI